MANKSMAGKVWLKKYGWKKYGCKSMAARVWLQSMAATKLYRPIRRKSWNTGKPIKNVWARDRDQWAKTAIQLRETISTNQIEREKAWLLKYGWKSLVGKVWLKKYGWKKYGCKSMAAKVWLQPNFIDQSQGRAEMRENQ
jgi:hypothetical protein